MPKFFYIFIFCIGISAFTYANEILKKAEKAYEVRDYKTAITTYEKLILEGNSAPELFYNLGNSYFKNNQLGKAIYNYERARKLNPNDPDIKNNLALAYTKTIDKIEVKENFFISAVKSNVLGSCSTKVWGWTTIGLSALFFAILFIFIVSDNMVLKRTSFFSSVIILIFFGITYFLGKSAKNAKLENSFAVVTTPTVKVFTEPSSSSVSKFNLHEGTKVKIIENNSDWVLIKLENGNEGWLKGADVGVF